MLSMRIPGTGVEKKLEENPGRCVKEWEKMLVLWDGG